MQRTHTARRGMTLVELLAVVAIMVILMSLAIQIMRPGLKDRKLREASRQVNTFFALAKAKAAETGRPHGVAILNTGNAASFQLFLAEMPTIFAGGSYAGTDSVAILPDSGNGFAQTVSFQDPFSLVQDGDLIRFDFKGPLYRLEFPRDGMGLLIEPRPPNLPIVPLDFTNARYPLASATGVRFQVHRQPRASTHNSVTLPTGTVIDLAMSGFGETGIQLNGTPEGKHAFIMFTPSGAVDYSFAPPAMRNARATIHLLVGRIEKATGLELDPNQQNLADPTAQWVSIGDLTGTVTTAENVVPGNFSSLTAAGKLAQARAIAQSKQTMGGR
jgi:prepilin-type N-terminal cleavage/methylation domain-containing protein